MGTTSLTVPHGAFDEMASAASFDPFQTLGYTPPAVVAGWPRLHEIGMQIMA